MDHCEAVSGGCASVGECVLCFVFCVLCMIDVCLGKEGKEYDR